MKAAKCVLRYLPGKPDLSITYGAGSLKVAGSPDSSFNPQKEDQGRSCSSYIFFLAGGSISYRSQIRTAGIVYNRSPTVCPFYSRKGRGYLLNVLEELALRRFSSVDLSFDAQTAFHRAVNHSVSHRTKHIATKFNRLRMWVNPDRIVLKVPRGQQHASRWIHEATGEEQPPTLSFSC